MIQFTKKIWFLFRGLHSSSDEIFFANLVQKLLVSSREQMFSSFYMLAYHASFNLRYFPDPPKAPQKTSILFHIDDF